MKITINGDSKEIAEGLNVTGLLEDQKVESPDMVSVQVNEEFIEREDFDAKIISENDEIEFLYFMGGGAL